MQKDFLQGRIDSTKAQIIEYENASLSLAAGTLQSYSIDTGQTVQKVTKLEIKPLIDALDTLYNRLCMLEVRLNGTGTIQVVPSW